MTVIIVTNLTFVTYTTVLLAITLMAIIKVINLTFVTVITVITVTNLTCAKLLTVMIDITVMTSIIVTNVTSVTVITVLTDKPFMTFTNLTFEMFTCFFRNCDSYNVMCVKLYLSNSYINFLFLYRIY